jgi:hypothetical protein
VHPTGPKQDAVFIGHGQRVAGVVIGAAGVVAMGVSLGITLSAKSKYNSALKADCNDAANMCDDVGLTQTHDARSEANVGTIVFGVGAAAVVGGLITYLTAPKGLRAEHHDEPAAATEDESAFYLAPTFSNDGAGLVFGGRL